MRPAQARVKARSPLGGQSQAEAQQGSSELDEPRKKLRRVSFSDVVERFDIGALSETTEEDDDLVRILKGQEEIEDDFVPLLMARSARPSELAKSTTSKLPRRSGAVPPAPTPELPMEAPQRRARVWNSSRYQAPPAAQAAQPRVPKQNLQVSPEAGSRAYVQSGLSFDVVLPLGDFGGSEGPTPGLGELLQLGDVLVVDRLDPSTGQVLLRTASDQAMGLRSEDARRQQRGLQQQPSALARRWQGNRVASRAGGRSVSFRENLEEEHEALSPPKSKAFHGPGRPHDLMETEGYYDQAEEEEDEEEDEGDDFEEESPERMQGPEEPRNQFSDWIDDDPWEDEMEFEEARPKVSRPRTALPPRAKEPPQRQEARLQSRLFQPQQQSRNRARQQAWTFEPPEREEARTHPPAAGRTAEDVRERPVQAGATGRGGGRSAAGAAAVLAMRAGAGGQDAREERARAEAATQQRARAEAAARCEEQEEVSRALEASCEASCEISCQAQERASRARSSKTAGSRLQAHEEPRRQAEPARQSQAALAAEARRQQQQQQQEQREQREQRERREQQQQQQQQQQRAQQQEQEEQAELLQQQALLEERRQEAAAREQKRERERQRQRQQEAAEAEERQRQERLAEERRQERLAEERRREARRREQQAAEEAAEEERRRAAQAKEEKEQKRKEEEENRRVQAEAARRKAEQERKLLLESRKHELAAAKLQAKAAAEAVARRRELEAEEAAKKASVKEEESAQAARQANQEELARKKEELKEVQRKMQQQRAEIEAREERRRAEERRQAERKARQEVEAVQRAEEVHEPDARPHLHVALLGHERAGKSVLYGAILHAFGRWDARALARHKKELGTEETEVRRCCGVETKKARLMLLDVPGNPRCVPEAGRALAEADSVVLVVSAKGNEFDKAFDERFGPLREHALLAKGLGARSVVVAVNKMDEVQWSEARFSEISAAFGDFLHSIGFGQDDVTFVPVDGLSGELAASKAPWHTKGRLLDCLTAVKLPGPSIPSLPVRVLLLEAVKEKTGVLSVEGRVECGTLSPGQECMLAPLDATCTVQAVRASGRNVTSAGLGEAVQLLLQGVGDAADVPRGSVISATKDPVRAVTRLTAMMDVLELPQDRPLLTVGSRAVVHVHAVTSDCEILQISQVTNLSTGEVEQKPRHVRANHRARFTLSLFKALPVDEYCEGRGRLSLLAMRTDGRTIAVGRAVEVS